VDVTQVKATDVAKTLPEKCFSTAIELQWQYNLK
jgi:hypothetical protein